MTTNDDNEPIDIINMADVKGDDALIDAANAGDDDALRELIALFRAVNNNRNS
jgi:hypothetical protein